MSEKDFLDLFKISDGKFIIGIYQDGITVYKQQMRTLNIFHALVEQKIICFGSDFSIAVIGGGIAGVTFAATALKSNISVTLFEKEADYLHMQEGCDTRKIHPNIYEWPDPGSTFPNARLPVLSWTHDTASNVVKQIVNGLNDISRLIKASEHEQGPALFNEYKKSKIESITDPSPKTHNKFTIVHGSPKIKCYANLIIYAVGFGVEVDLDGSDAPSYWRNDALSQSILNDWHRFLISGTGDGALIDLCRLKIHNFSYERILELLKSDTKKYHALTFKLREIKKRGREKLASSGGIPPDYYDIEFNLLEENYYKYFYEAISQDLVHENYVIIHSRRPIENALDFERISLLNAFMAYLLKRDNQFEYRQGELTRIGAIYSLNGVPIDDVDQFIIRHGTDKTRVTEGLTLSVSEKKSLETLEGKQKKAAQIDNCWSFDSISRCFKAGSANPAYAVLPYLKRSEYLTPDTKAICLSQVMILAKTISRFHKISKHFRLALHRVTRFDDRNYFQQITPYQGSKKMEDNGCYGNVHDVDHGVVGQAIVSGKPVMIVNTNEQEFARLSRALHLDKVRDHAVTPKSFLAIPIVAPVKPSNLATNLVFYMDADEIDFFDRAEIFEVIVSSLSGMVEYIEKMIEHNMIAMSELEFTPAIISGFEPATIVDNECFLDLEKGDKSYPTKTNLKFKEFYSFDIIYNK